MSDKIKDGRSAFPLFMAISRSGDTHIGYPGMSLRDYFAIRCLPQWFGTGSPESRAKAAYADADAMLKARGEA